MIRSIGSSPRVSQSLNVNILAYLHISVTGLIIWMLPRALRSLEGPQLLAASKVYNVVSTCFTFSVAFFVIFLGYVHLTSPNVRLYRGSYSGSQEGTMDRQRIRSDFLKNLNASIRRMDYDREYVMSNLSRQGGMIETNGLNPEEEEGEEKPLFVDVVKVSRLSKYRRKGLPDATQPHDLSGYVSILHPKQAQLELECATCSLVCSSGHLLHSKLGRTIDAANCVFRMNDAPSRGYSKDVGSRTTLRMIGFQAMPKVLENKGALLEGSARPRYITMWGPERELTANGTGKGYNHLRALSMMLERGGTESFILGPEEMAYNNKVYEAETGQERKCVIVSSSSHILHSGAGSTINADRQCIFRMNTAPTLFFEPDVGARTTVRVLSHASVSGLFKSQKDLLGHPNATKFLVAWGPHKYMKTGGASERRLRGLASHYPNVDFYIASEEEVLHADKLFEKETGRPRSKSGSWLTTGWFTMILARSVCGEIHVYGMVGENYCRHDRGRKVPYHYYNSHSQDECEYYRSMEKALRGGHRFMTEKAVFASWSKLTPKIYFHQPEWD